MKKIFTLVLCTLFATPGAFAAQRYIADNLFTYMHSGPSNQFRIIGSVNAGDKVNLINTDKSTGYSEVVDSKGRKGWVESKFVTNRPSISVRLPALEQELATVKEKLANAEKSADKEQAGLLESLDIRNKQIAELEKSYSDMSQQLTSSQSEIRELRARLDTQKEDLLLKYFIYGGGVAGIGLLFGLILPHIIPRRKKSRNGWAD
ncbi:TIGR04211 family SH3 domain-containing protein [Vibrio hannami]|uniref:TIGR04211 family SH3 domain-containing protein n=1 Tax=Vibrio hannami TaxID=2717094 RepID=UPI00240F1298|nr:TIGR04211 family SH3 domain-containing protein [Vibrio hannami]MDG3089094.1 TIGR04211 family SH3 domain-containing protein [Vibrio hannami]